MFAIHSLEDAQRELDAAIINRLVANPVAKDTEALRFPVGLMFLRGDRKGPGEAIAQQLANSYAYWNADSSDYFDLVFFGWGTEDRNGPPIYSESAFLHCKNQVEKVSKWRYTGETDLVLLDYECPMADGYLNKGGAFSFKRAIYLPVERMIDSKKILSLDGLVQELINHAKDARKAKRTSDVWELSDRIAYYRGRRALWDWFRKLLFRDLDEVWKELRPFAICDLSV